ncbi:MAG: IclR family transcriptional regulator [Phycisphaeraceae bacterium]|nr:IclR family transcriptional regulator [Phycisphaeraceae bacterium]
MTKRDKTRYHIPNLSRGMTVLEYLSSHPSGRTLSQAAEDLGFPMNSIYRIIATLEDQGYVTMDGPTRQYQLTRKLLVLGLAQADGGTLLDQAIPVLQALRDESDETTLLGVLTENYGTVIHQVLSNQPVKVCVQIGIRFDLHSTAPGKAMLAAMPDEPLQKRLKSMKFTKHTPRTITQINKLKIQLEQTRKEGYATDCDESLEGMSCVGGAILDASRQPCAAIWVTGPSSRLNPKRLKAIGKKLCQFTASLQGT